MNSDYDHIVRILVRHSKEGLSLAQICPETPVIGSGLNLTSIELLEAIVEIEHAMGVKLRDEDLTVQFLSSTGTLAAHVSSLRSRASE